MGITTPLGEFLDPVADKLMVATALVLLVGHDTRPLIVITAVVIIGREITVSALREWMAHLGARAKVAVSAHGQVEDHPADDGPQHDDVPQDVFGLPIYELGVVLLVVAARADALVDGGVPAGRLAGTAPKPRPLTGRGFGSENSRLPKLRLAGVRAGVAQLVERDLAKVEVTSSSLVTRSSSPHDPGPPGVMRFWQHGFGHRG